MTERPGAFTKNGGPPAPLFAGTAGGRGVCLPGRYIIGRSAPPHQL
jgi:hypothetical protein